VAQSAVQQIGDMDRRRFDVDNDFGGAGYPEIDVDQFDGFDRRSVPFVHRCPHRLTPAPRLLCLI
jgi:hypothetical protein